SGAFQKRDESGGKCVIRATASGRLVRCISGQLRCLNNLHRGTGVAPRLLPSRPAMYQRTIRKAVSVGGIGLHSGQIVHVTIAPAPPHSGIVFRVPGHGEPIPAAPESVVDSHYATTVGRNGTRIQTVEHLLAAAAGLGIDNLDVIVDGAEIPAADG